MSSKFLLNLKNSIYFTDSETLDITNKEEVNDFFWQNAPDFCINAAAYTAVDLAETDIEKKKKAFW